MLVVTLLGMEAVLWILGYRPYRNSDYSVEISPYPAFAADDSLGIRLVPGYFDITLNDSLHFHATHSAEGRRLVSPASPDSLPQIWLMGCSFTYGYGVDDAQHFSSLLQAAMPDHQFLDFGVPGYGTAQSCLQLENQLAWQIPEQVILIFSAVHPNRNALTPSFRKDLKIGFNRSDAANDALLHDARFPFGDAEGNILFEDWDRLYTHHPIRSWSALVNLAYTTTESIQQKGMDTRAISEALIRRMYTDCTQAGVSFTVACLDTSEDTEAIKKALNDIDLNWVDIEFDFEQPELTNVPYDSHPNPEGHRFIADQIRRLVL
jgi:hypothetical protein